MGLTASNLVTDTRNILAATVGRSEDPSDSYTVTLDLDNSFAADLRLHDRIMTWR